MTQQTLIVLDALIQTEVPLAKPSSRASRLIAEFPVLASVATVGGAGLEVVIADIDEDLLSSDPPQPFANNTATIANRRVKNLDIFILIFASPLVTEFTARPWLLQAGAPFLLGSMKFLLKFQRSRIRPSKKHFWRIAKKARPVYCALNCGFEGTGHRRASAQACRDLDERLDRSSRAP
jgi:hypothetical protein